MLLLVLAAATVAARLPPIDQCGADPSFARFRSELRHAVEKRDAEALLAVVADDVHASLGGHVGKEDFIELWQLSRPRASKVWEELGEALRLGCTMRDGVATVASMEDQIGDRDAFETRIALPGAVLRARPDGKSHAIARLSWDVLSIRGAWDGGRWLPVRLDDGRSGYVLERQARSPIDYRAWFRMKNGQWQMAGFLAGD